MNPIRAATLCVSDLAAATARFADKLDYRAIESDVIGADMGARFGAPGIAGSAYVVLRPSSGRAMDLRLIEQPAIPGFLALRTYGWAAIEICIQDVKAVHQRMIDSPFEVIGPPAPNSGLPQIHPMQVQGPDQEVIFLTQILQGGPGSGLPTAQAPVDSLFICVLACRDMAAQARWFERHLEVAVPPSVEIPYRTLSRAFGFPPDHRHRITTGLRHGEIFLEFDQYPAEATERPRITGRLPPGVSVVTLTHPDLGSVTAPWLTVPAIRDGAIYEGRRSGVLATPEGALVELVEGEA